MSTQVQITYWSNNSGKTIGYAEGKVADKEFTASWAGFSPLCGLFYDSWQGTSRSENKAIAKALNDLAVVPPVETVA